MKQPRLKEIDPKQIRKNRENPRLHFPQERLDELAASIDRKGVLVPISVYENPDAETQYVLIDGERRWRCSLQLGRSDIPAMVIDEPDDTENLLTMFEIHKVRDDWDNMPTAWALGKLMERTGKTDPDELAEMAGIAKDQIKRYLLALQLPREYQDLIDAGQLSLNFFYELHNNVIMPLAKQRPAILRSLSEERIRRAFVEKKLSKVLSSDVDLRKMRPIINVAMQEAGGPEAASDLDSVITQLVENPATTIDEAYENTVEMVVEAGKFARQCRSLIARYDRLVAKAHSDDERQMIVDAVQRLVTDLTSRLPGSAT